MRKKQEVSITLICRIITFATFVFLLKMSFNATWPQSFSFCHLLNFLNFVVVLCLFRINMNVVHMNCYQEDDKQARKLYHDLISPLLALQLLVEKPLKGLNKKENQFLKTIADEIVKHIENFRYSTSINNND